jgi:Lrp/AsnC family transcriptional regulator of lysine biosynthesis
MEMKEIDEVDEKILRILKANARTPLSTIAEELGISKTAVKKRIDKLVKRGVIGRFTIEFSSTSGVRALVFIKTEAKGKTTDAAQSIKKISFVDRVFEVAGEYDIVAIVSALNVEQLNEIVDRIREIPNVSSTVTIMVLKEY